MFNKIREGTKIDNGKQVHVFMREQFHETLYCRQAYIMKRAVAQSIPNIVSHLCGSSIRVTNCQEHQDEAGGDFLQDFRV